MRFSSIFTKHSHSNFPHFPHDYDLNEVSKNDKTQQKRPKTQFTEKRRVGSKNWYHPRDQRPQITLKWPISSMQVFECCTVILLFSIRPLKALSIFFINLLVPNPFRWIPPIVTNAWLCCHIPHVYLSKCNQDEIVVHSTIAPRLTMAIHCLSSRHSKQWP